MREGSETTTTGYRVGLIVPLREEFEYVSQVVHLTGELVDQGRRFYRFDVPSADVNGLIAVLFDMGQPAAAVVADHLLRRMDVSIVALVGTAGGLGPDLRLGDIVVASEVQSYLQSAKAIAGSSDDRFDIRTAPTSWRPSDRLVGFVRHFATAAGTRDRFRRWRGSAVLHRPVASAVTAQDDQPRYLVGPIATGEIVGAAASFGAWLLRTNRKLLAVEMEAGGAAASVYQHGSADLLVIRGITDFADEDKALLDRTADEMGRSNAWRRYATRNAAEFFVALISSPDFPWPTTQALTPAPSGPTVTGQADSHHVDGYVAAVRIRRAGRGSVRGTARADIVGPDGELVGVEITDLE